MQVGTSFLDEVLAIEGAGKITSSTPVKHPGPGCVHPEIFSVRAKKCRWTGVSYDEQYRIYRPARPLHMRQVSSSTGAGDGARP